LKETESITKDSIHMNNYTSMGSRNLPLKQVVNKFLVFMEPEV